MLFNLLLARYLIYFITILLCFFFLFLVFFNIFFTISVEIENAKRKLALIIPTGAPMTVANDAIEMLPVVTDKTFNDSSNYSKEAIYLQSLSFINSLSLISVTK